MKVTKPKRAASLSTSGNKTTETKQTNDKRMTESQPSSSSNALEGFTIYFVTLGILLSSIFIPNFFLDPTVKGIGGVFLSVFLCLFTEHFVFPVMLVAWFVWYTLQYKAVGLVISLYGIWSIPTVLAAIWFAFGLESKVTQQQQQSNTTVRLYLVIPIVLYMFFTIVTFPTPMTDIVGSILIGFVYLTSGLLFFQLGAQNVPHHFVSTAWILLTPPDSIPYGILRAIFAFLLLRVYLRTKMGLLFSRSGSDEEESKNLKESSYRQRSIPTTHHRKAAYFEKNMSKKPKHKKSTILNSSLAYEDDYNREGLFSAPNKRTGYQSDHADSVDIERVIGSSSSSAKLNVDPAEVAKKKESLRGSLFGIPTSLKKSSATVVQSEDLSPFHNLTVDQ